MTTTPKQTRQERPARFVEDKRSGVDTNDALRAIREACVYIAGQGWIDSPGKVISRIDGSPKSAHPSGIEIGAAGEKNSLHSGTASAYEEVGREKLTEEQPSESSSREQKAAAPKSRRASYLQPSRDGKRGLVTYVEPELAEQFKVIAAASGSSAQTLIYEFVASVVASGQDSIDEIAKGQARLKAAIAPRSPTR